MTVDYAPSNQGWVAIVRGELIVWLGVEPDDCKVLKIWNLLSNPSTAIQVLDVLTDDGVHVTPPFVIAHPMTDVTTVLARGKVTVSTRSADSELSFDASTFATWTERTVVGKAAIRLSLENGVPTGRLPLGEGVAIAAVLEWGDWTDRDLAPTLGKSKSDGETPDGDDHQVLPHAEADVTLTDEDLRERREQSTGAKSEPVIDAADEDLHSELFGATIYRSIEDAAVRPFTEATADGSPQSNVRVTGPERSDYDGADHDGMTIAVGEAASLRGSLLSVPVFNESAPALNTPFLVLRTSEGVQIDLSRPVIVGRRPTVSTPTAAGDLPQLITPPGDNPDLSRNHAQFALEGDTVVVTDLHSQNGTFFTLPGESQVRLRAGEPTTVVAGTSVDLGGGTVYLVEAAQ